MMVFIIFHTLTSLVVISILILDSRSEEQAIPVNDGIRALCEILGDDQLPRISYLYVKDMLKNGRIIYESSCLRYIRRKEKRGDNAF